MATVVHVNTIITSVYGRIKNGSVVDKQNLQANVEDMSPESVEKAFSQIQDDLARLQEQYDKNEKSDAVSEAQAESKKKNQG